MLLAHAGKVTFIVSFAVLITGSARAYDCIIIETLRHHAATFFHNVKGDLKKSGSYQGTYIPGNKKHIECTVDVWGSTENITTYGNYSCDFYTEKWRENESAAKGKFEKFRDAVRNCVAEPESIEIREERDSKLDLVTEAMRMYDGTDNSGARYVDVSYSFSSHYWIIRLQYSIEKAQQ